MSMFAPKSDSQVSRSFSRTTVYVGGWDRHSAMADYITAQVGLEASGDYVVPDAVDCRANYGAPARIVVTASCSTPAEDSAPSLYPHGLWSR